MRQFLQSWLNPCRGVAVLFWSNDFLLWPFWHLFEGHRVPVCD